MKPLRIGVPPFLSVRPLIFGIIRNPGKNADLVYAEPGVLARSLECGEVDAALIPSIEYLRGVGRFKIDGPALIARKASNSLILIANKELSGVQRVAVDEFSRTPIAVLRVVLDNLFGALPDICVAKNMDDNWKDSFDAILLTGDRGLRRSYRSAASQEKIYNLSELWYSLTAEPLVLLIWAYNDERLGGILKKILIASRNLGYQNLSLLSDGISQTCEYTGEFLYNQYSQGWHYDMGAAEARVLRLLEEHAVRYQLILQKRPQDNLTEVSAHF
ncbi:MAG: MqnA/MqnD/SBP family protein [Candidatus Latescibacterota bacterium]